MEDKRSFTVVSVSTKRNKKGSDNLGGRYLSTTPAGAARKATSQICRKSSIRGQCTLFVSIQETTRGSTGKIFNYKIKRVLVNEKVSYGCTVINHKYKTTVHKI